MSTLSLTPTNMTSSELLKLALETIEAKGSSLITGPSSTYGRSVFNVWKPVPNLHVPGMGARTEPMTDIDIMMQEASNALAASARTHNPDDRVSVYGHAPILVKDVRAWEKKQADLMKQKQQEEEKDETFMDVIRSKTQDEYIIRVRFRNQFLFKETLTLTGTQYLDRGKQLIEDLIKTFVVKRIEESTAGLEEDEDFGQQEIPF